MTGVASEAAVILVRTRLPMVVYAFAVGEARRAGA